MNKEELHSILEEVKNQTKKQAFSIEVNTDRKPGIFDSKFGGVPYWDMTKEYPRNHQGQKLMLLAQINFEEHEFGTVLPKKGILQFFITPEDVFGLDFDEQDDQNGFRVVYHETLNTTVTKEEVLQLDIPQSTDTQMEEYGPLTEEFAVDFTNKQVSMGPDADFYNEVFYEAAKKLGIEVDQDEAVDDIICDIYGQEEYDDLFDKLSNDGHWLLGQPYFTQSDPREYEEKYSRYDTLLFQMDSDYDEKHQYIMWGDVGVANFFINEEDLKKRDFSKILYNWDCC